jgi:guanylate kinase
LSFERDIRDIQKILVLINCSPLTDTSREAKEGEEDGKGYRFVTRNKMTELRRANQFLEHGEYNGNMYGTSIESVRSVIDQHKMCVLDIQPAVSLQPGKRFL